MMEDLLQSSNLHNVMETDTTAAKMWYLICDNLPSVFRSSIFCQHKLKWVSGKGSISVRHVPVTYARLLINCNHQSKVLDSCSRCDPKRGALPTLLPFLSTVCAYWTWLLSPRHTEVILFIFPMIPEEDEGSNQWEDNKEVALCQTHITSALRREALSPPSEL